MNRISCFLFLLCSLNPLIGAAMFNSDLADLLNGTTSHIMGPNCWNGALYTSGLIEDKKFVSPEEWAYILKKNCTQVSSPSYGNIGRIRQKNGDEVHGFIHIDESTVFAKHGEAVKDGYKYMSYSEMLTPYGRTRRCREKRDFSEICHNDITYYECDTKVEKNLYVQNLALLAEELAFSTSTKNGSRANCESEIFEEREMIFEEMITEIDNIKTVSHFLTKVDILSLDSLREQIYNTEVSNRYFKCKDRSRKALNIKKVKRSLKELLLFLKS